MKTTFYCVAVEFFDCGEIKAAVTTQRETVKKPKSQFQQVHGLTAFKFWMWSKSMAAEITKLVNSGEMHIDSCIELFQIHAKLDNRLAA